MKREPLVILEIKRDVARLTLNRPQRHNSLIPELVTQLNDALDEVRRQSLVALVLAGAGRSFSTGGDVAAFHAVPRGKRRAYAHTLVGGLNRAILALIDLPFPVLARVHGPTTGGSLGLVLAADLVVMASSAFIAPYYVDIGFAPDGGWTAMLPHRIGIARARAIQLLNHHVSANDALALGLATRISQDREIDTIVDGWIAALRTKVSSGVRATRELLMQPEQRSAIAAGLQHELDRFLDEIETDAAEAGMARFLAVA
jgi:2-(1,2-epoxy-1,2-dihydrophenyl)acetyl-CoA isomerase